MANDFFSYFSDEAPRYLILQLKEANSLPSVRISWSQMIMCPGVYFSLLRTLVFVSTLTNGSECSLYSAIAVSHCVLAITENAREKSENIKNILFAISDLYRCPVLICRGKGSEYFFYDKEKSEKSILNIFFNTYSLYFLSRSFVRLSWQIDGGIGLHGQDAKLKLCVFI